MFFLSSLLVVFVWINHKCRYLLEGGRPRERVASRYETDSGGQCCQLLQQPYRTTTCARIAGSVGSASFFANSSDPVPWMATRLGYASLFVWISHHGVSFKDGPKQIDCGMKDSSGSARGNQDVDMSLRGLFQQGV
jgi:hypothetical protein